MANYRKYDGFICLTENSNQGAAEVLAECMFDEQVAADIEEIKAEQKLIKTLNRVALAKITLYPIEYLFTLVFAGREGAKAVKEQFRIYLSFYRGKMSLEALKEIV